MTAVSVHFYRQLIKPWQLLYMRGSYTESKNTPTNYQPNLNIKSGDFMHSGVYSIDELRVILVPAFKAYPVHQGYVFGSYSRGEATENSDIDLFVEPADGFKSYEVCGILSRAMKLTGKGVDCYSRLDFDENTQIYERIMRDRVLVYESDKMC